MSWLQTHTLRLRAYERAPATGRVVFVIYLQLGQQEDGRAKETSKRSYSEFRTLWKELLCATSGCIHDIESRGDLRSTLNIRSRESWSSVSRLLTGSFRVGSGDRSKKKYCRCTETSCPFQRLYHLLRDFSFPRKQLLRHKDASALEQRMVELQDFTAQLQRFFYGYPRSFLETAASTHRCDVLKLLSKFSGVDTRPASLSATTEAFTGVEPVERTRYFSYCASSPSSPSPMLLTDSTDHIEETLVADERMTDNQTDQGELLDEEGVKRLFIQSSDVASPSVGLPQLHITSTVVETFDAPLDEVKDNLLRTMGVEVQAAIERKQLSVEDQWEFALFHAAGLGLYADVVTILRRGTNPNSRVWSEATPLHAASGDGHVHVVQCLLSHGADVDRQGSIGMTPLMCAVNNCQLETTKVLLRAGADVNLCNVRNVSPVHLAVVNRSLPMLLLLLDHGATVDVPNSVNGRTPLHIAAEDGDKEICEILLKYGARVSQCNASGRDATELAVEHGHWGIQDLCSQYRRGTTTTLIEEGEEEETKYQDDEDSDAERFDGRTFRAQLDYIDECTATSEGEVANEHDVAIVSEEGTMYAVL